MYDELYFSYKNSQVPFNQSIKYLLSKKYLNILLFIFVFCNRSYD